MEGVDSIKLSFCIEPNKIPVKNNELYCSGYKYNVNETEILQVFPFPQHGIWIFSAALQCFNSDGNRHVAV